jgi:excisionase family DNA binding protein
MSYEIRLSPRVIAVYCQVSKSTVLKWIKDGKLQAFRLPSGHYRIDKEDFRDFLKRYDIPIKEELFGSESEKKGGKK